MIISKSDISSVLSSIIKENKVDKIFILVDINTDVHCLPKIDFGEFGYCRKILIDGGESCKDLATVTSILNVLINENATRHSLLINLGGGVVSDIGGFAASVYKRGMYFVNVPTTLLSAVDASTGGKTGVNHNNLKNVIGTFCDPLDTLVSVDFYDTLHSSEVLSGFAEMIKHGLLLGEELYISTINYDIERFGKEALVDLIDRNIRFKERIVALDPEERGIRKALNLGHTIGHAIETLQMMKGKPVLHGYAVMWGLIGELYLSCVKFGLENSVLLQVASFSKQFYGQCPIMCRDYDDLLTLMAQDKKNSHGSIHFTLLRALGEYEIDQVLEIRIIKEALDFIREN